MIHLILRKKRLFLLCLLWFLLLAVLAVEPQWVVKIFFPSSQARSGAHVLFYGVLAFVLCLYARFKRNLGTLHLRNRYVVILSFLLTSLFGGITEIMQLWTPDRLADFGDLGFDMLGAIIGISCFYLFRGLL